MDDAAKEYQSGEFKRRYTMSSLRQELQALMLEKHQNLWWCKDEALSLIRKQMAESSNHCVVDNFLGSEACAAVRQEVRLAFDSNLLSTEVCTIYFLSWGSEARTDCSCSPTPPR